MGNEKIINYLKKQQQKSDEKDKEIEKLKAIIANLEYENNEKTALLDQKCNQTNKHKKDADELKAENLFLRDKVEQLNVKVNLKKTIFEMEKKLEKIIFLFAICT
ncbi:hypothetical protein RFI_21887 [Reticulomyxa filosa]|uniref:Uncharacterized protein n=1 Tax=Reticulomyxa filosa TaxID=46433 RepID=X6MNB1_RETFI|nr:hypothetical protein RFI_21887 [Reticulomyxa filosa]|eukprot:ETO15478.1 hypothetical protein RFI_21887 [Reticulomyxa filosa]